MCIRDSSAPSRATSTRLATWFSFSARSVSWTSSSLSSTSRMSCSSAIRPPSVEREVERRSGVYSPLGPDRAAVPPHDALHGSEADAGAGELVGGVKPLERREQLVDVGRVEAGAVVAHVVRGDAVAPVDPDLDVRLRLARSELPGVRKKVLQHDAQQRRVAVGDETVRHRRVDGALRLRLPQVGEDVARQRREVDLLTHHLPAGDPRQQQQVVDELPHALRGGALAGQVAVSYTHLTLPTIYSV